MQDITQKTRASLFKELMVLVEACAQSLPLDANVNHHSVANQLTALIRACMEDAYEAGWTRAFGYARQLVDQAEESAKAEAEVVAKANAEALARAEARAATAEARALDAEKARAVKSVDLLAPLADPHPQGPARKTKP
jgi:hypothetical protein